MPNFDSFDGIKINIYYDEHLPPHIHAVCGDYEVLVVIETGEIYEDWLPVRQLKKSRQWLTINMADALFAFKALNPHLNAPRKKKNQNIKGKK